MSNKIYPIGIQNFEKIRRDGYFIDKTALVYQMVKTGSYYFLSRQRRFGKSLSSLPWKLTFKVRRSCLKVWQWRSWKRIGSNILFCIWI